MIMYRMICQGYDDNFVRFLQRNAHWWLKAPPKKNNEDRKRRIRKETKIEQ